MYCRCISKLKLEFPNFIAFLENFRIIWFYFFLVLRKKCIIQYIIQYISCIIGAVHIHVSYSNLYVLYTYV